MFQIGPNANAVKVYHPPWRTPDQDDEMLETDPNMIALQGPPEKLREDLQIQLIRRFRLLWRSFYKQHNGSTPRVSRTLTIEKVTPWIQEIYKDRFTSEAAHETGGRYQAIISTSFQTFFYTWLVERYFLREIAMDVAYDILTLLVRHDADNLVPINSFDSE